MPMPSDDYMSSANEKLCINFFNDLFDIDDLKRLIQDFDPLNVERRKLTKKHEIQNFNKSKENKTINAINDSNIQNITDNAEEVTKIFPRVDFCNIKYESDKDGTNF